MKAYWINVDDSHGRREYMEKQFVDVGWENNERVSASTPDNMEDLVHKNNLPFCCDVSQRYFKNCKNCEKEFAVLLSHMRAIEKFYEDGEKYCIIFEDDVVISVDIDWDMMKRYMPSDAECLQLYTSNMRTLNMFYELYRDRKALWIPWKFITPCCSGYVVSRDGAKKLIDKFKKGDQWDFSSSEYCKLSDSIIYQTLKTYTSLYPTYYSSEEFYSLIHPDHQFGHSLGNRRIVEILKSDKSHPFVKYIDNEMFRLTNKFDKL